MKNKSLSKSGTTFLPPPLLLLISAIALIVSGCGGGGGGGAARVFDVFEASASEQSFVDFVTATTRTSAQRTALRSSVRTSAGGSRSQNQYSINNDGVSQIDITDSNYYGVRSVSSSSSRLELTFINLNLNTFDINSDSTTSTQVSGHLDYTSYNIDESNSGGINVMALNSHTSTNADYMVFGYWIYDDDNTWDSSNTQVGAFAHSRQSGEDLAMTPDYINTSGSARYEGDVTGIVFTDVNNQVGHLSGHVSLRANFGPGASISGTISQIQSSNPDIATVSDITLEQSSFNRQRFAGTTRASLGGTSLSGQWGGALFGAEADRAVGTFSVGAAGSHDIIGAFGAEEQ